jgi:hypothetical protein
LEGQEADQAGVERARAIDEAKAQRAGRPFPYRYVAPCLKVSLAPEERFSVTHSGKTEPILPMLSADTGRLELQGGATKSVIEGRLSEQPAAIRDVARDLSRKFRSQVSELKRQRPNDPDRIAQLDNLVVISGNMATGLAHLADNLDQAISRGSKDKPEPVFLGES